MSLLSEPSNVLIRPDDLRCVAEVAKLRIPSASAEGRRIARVRALLIAAGQLNRALTAFTHDALVHCHGTPGTSDLDADTRVLADALGIFSNELRGVTEEYRGVVASHAAVADTSAPRATAPRGRRASADLSSSTSLHV
jgi:hypothetical protein